MDERDTVNILKEIKSIISSDTNMDHNFIGLFYYLKLLKEKNIEYRNIINKFVINIECVLEIDYGCNIKVDILDMNYESKELIFDIKIGSNVRRVYLFKNEKDRLISRGDNTSLGYDILTMMDSNMVKLYNIMLEYESFINRKSEGIKIENTNFYIDIYYDKVIVYYGKNKEKSEMVIEIDSSLNYTYISNNIDLVNQFKEMEDNFMKKIDIDIRLLPEWAQSDLVTIKGNQIMTEMIKKKEELRAQKRVELLNKIMSVFKKR